MEQWNSVLHAIGERFGPYAPRLFGAAAILLLAWVLARVARSVVTRLLSARGIEARLQTPGLGALLANLAYWLVWLFALPALLGTLELEGLLAPVNAMMSRMLGFMPNVMGAAVIFGIGFIAARIVRQLVTGALTAAGSEKLAERLGLGAALRENSLAGLVGSVAFALVLLPTLTAALQALGLEAVAKPVGHLLDSVVDLIPKLVSAAIIVAIGAVLGRMLAGMVTALLVGAGFNRLPGRLGLAEPFRVGGRDASELVGSVIMAAAVLLAVTQACEVLGFAVLTEAVAVLGAVLAKLLVAVVVFGVGLWLATIAARAIAASAVANAGVLANLARGAILFFTAALALRQTGLPGDIITITFGSVIGAVALAVAIAAGVGGRHVAGRLLERAVASFQRKKDDGEGGAN